MVTGLRRRRGGGGWTSTADVRRAAHRRLPRMVFDFIDGGAEDERTVRANRQGFADLALLPRVLAGAGAPDLRTTVAGQELDLPVVLAPAGLLRLVDPAGEVAAVRAAGRAGTAFTLSTGSSCTVEDVGRAATGPWWFQLYLWRDRGVVEDLIARARQAGATALVLTADVPVVGQRERDLRNGMTLPPRPGPRSALDMVLHPRWVGDALRGGPITFANFTDVGRGDSATALADFVNREMTDPAQRWADLEWLRGRWDGPLLLKGVVAPDDARRAADVGCEGVVVSNHGGRQLDAMVGAVDALPDVADAVGDRLDVLLDGGVRRGTDVAKALALGARAVMVGRPYVFGLAAGGEVGALRAIEILRDELARALTLLGCARAADLDRRALHRGRGLSDRGRNPVDARRAHP